MTYDPAKEDQYQVLSPEILYDDARYIYNFTTGVIYSKPKRGKELMCIGTNGYNRTTVNGKIQLVHRVLYKKCFGAIPEGMEIDHINGNRLDNSINNLRVVTKSQNQQNKRKSFGTSSKYKNVTWHKAHQKWQVQFSVQGKQKHFGYFATEEEAAAKAKQARRELVAQGLHVKSSFE